MCFYNIHTIYNFIEIQENIVLFIVFVNILILYLNIHRNDL